LQGASAVQKILRENPDLNVRVFAVWEPILPTDFSRPMGIILSRLSDRRVTQFWDQEHALASRIAKDARSPQPTQKCCVRNDHLWDLVAVYATGAKWDAQMPTAEVFDGPVLYVDDQLRQALAVKE
jgi:hypothetical protein